MKEPAEATATSSGVQAITPLSQIESTPSKCWHIFQMPIPATTQRSCSPSGILSSSASPPLPIVVVPELAISPYAHPEQINLPGHRKDYKCQLCSFQNTNRDCMLMHIHQHLEISIRCPICGKGFQNVALL